MRPVIDPASGLPIGPLDDGPPATRPDRRMLAGRFVTLVPLDPAQHGDDLFAGSRGPEHDRLWLYLNAGPFAERSAFGTYLDSIAGRDEPVTLAIVDKASGRAAGHLGLMRIKPAHKVIEVGNVLFTAAVSRTPGGTEAIYLAARHVFDDLGFVRFEWKCNALNAPSRRAALRFGFTFEGVFPRHMIQKGRLRDTAWFSMLASEWPARRAAFEAWLAPRNFDADGRQKARLGDMMADAAARGQGEDERSAAAG